MSDQVENVLIVGSGPAGLTAAIYAARANLNPLMIEGLAAGGQLMLTTEVENYPGFANGIMGPALMKEMRDQAERFGTRFLRVNADRVDFSEHPFTVEADGETYRSRTVIISTGATARLIGVPGELELMGRGVSTCATCDGAFFREKEIVVVGGGDSAMEEANFLTRFGKRVRVIHRRAELRASKIMQDRALANPKIEFLYDTVVTEAREADGKLGSIVLENVKTGEKTETETDAMFVAIGHTPTTELFREQLECDENGYLITHDGAKTSVDGVFACGDVQDHVYRQAITAAGSGCMAAIDAERWLEEHGS